MIQNTDPKLEGSKLLHKSILDSSCSISVFLLLTYRRVFLLALAVLMQVIYCSQGREKHRTAFGTEGLDLS